MCPKVRNLLVFQSRAMCNIREGLFDSFDKPLIEKEKRLQTAWKKAAKENNERIFKERGIIVKRTGSHYEGKHKTKIIFPIRDTYTEQYSGEKSELIKKVEAELLQLQWEMRSAELDFNLKTFRNFKKWEKTLALFWEKMHTYKQELGHSP